MNNGNTRPKIEVIVNKSFELDGFMAGLADSGFLDELTPPDSLKTPAVAKGYRSASPRASFHLPNIDVTIRCIEDIMPPTDSEISETSSSHSQQKAMLLKGYLRTDAPDLVVSVSTAESTPAIQPESTSQNGSVVIGGRFFTYDARRHDPDSPSQLEAPPFAENNAIQAFYSLMAPDAIKKEAVERFRIPPKSPARPAQILCDANYISVAAINVVNYEAYADADPAAYKACVAEHGEKFPATIETTHGIVRMCAGTTPTLFVSPITDRYTHFDEDVNEAQNNTAGYNAGVTVAMFLREVNIHRKKLFLYIPEVL